MTFANGSGAGLPYCSITSGFGKYFAGSCDGVVFILTHGGGQGGKSGQAHKGPVNVVSTNAAQVANIIRQSLVISGGEDGKIITWKFANNAMTLQQTYDVTALTQYPAKIQSISSMANLILIGTKGGEIRLLKGFIHSLDQQNWSCLMQGHYDKEVWCLALNAKGNQVVTGGGDQTIRLWNYSTNCMIVGSKPLKENFMSLSFV